MAYLKRKITPLVQRALDRDKSILLLGARQTGKTTLIQNEIKPHFYYSFIQPEIRQRYEKQPGLLGKEIEAEINRQKITNPLIAIDEIQKIPFIPDIIQDLIDRKIGRFVLTGSSARKLKHGASINLLPGRVLLFHLEPLALSEFQVIPELETLLLYGSLPGIYTASSNQDKNSDLHSYVSLYIEEEIRAEALVRNVANFAKFLYLASVESGNIINFSKLSQDIGVAHTTIATYFQILEDCLLAERIEPLTISSSRRRLSKAVKYLFFDLGVRRLCAEEGVQLPLLSLSHLFEQFVGLELIRYTKFSANLTKIRYWRTHTGAEIDFIIEQDQCYLPIEVKWTKNPTEKDCRHLMTFLAEYPTASQGYIICQTPKRFLINKKITAIPWQEIPEIFIKDQIA